MSNQQQAELGPAPDRGVYGISVAAELCGAPIQSIRLWERRGLLTPARTPGGTRRYSATDLALITRIAALAAAGVNIAGITRILDLEEVNNALRTAGLAASGSAVTGVGSASGRTIRS